MARQVLQALLDRRAMSALLALEALQVTSDPVEGRATRATLVLLGSAGLLATVGRRVFPATLAPLARLAREGPSVPRATLARSARLVAWVSTDRRETRAIQVL